MAALIPGMGGWELILILFIVLILFGPKRLPALGKSLGKTMKAIREGVDGKGDEDEDEDAPAKPKAKKKDKDKDAEEDEDEEE